MQHSPAYSAVTKEMFCDAKKNPGIIHYMGDERPWIRGNLNHYRKAYDRYLAMTPWKGTPKEKGRSLSYDGLCHCAVAGVAVACEQMVWDEGG